jgi:glycosyltransferase involved in cell wall biosynthesis
MKMGRLKVLHLIHTFPRLSGAADNTRYTVNLLDPDRYEVHLACGPAGLDASPLAPHVRLIVVKALVRDVAPMSDLRAAWALYRLFRQERYDIVHTHTSKGGVLGRIAARLAGVPVTVHTAHTISFAVSPSRFANAMFRLADKACAPLCEKIITVSTMNTTSYLDAGIGRPEQYITIYSGIDIQQYRGRSERSESRAELGIQDGEVLVVWIGRLDRQKDPVTFIRAAKHIADRFSHVRFVMVGEVLFGDSLEPKVRNLIQELRLDSKLSLLGYRPDVAPILAAADLVMHSSLYEGLGRSVIESMLSGVPLVATSVDGVREAVLSGERGGLLAPPGDPEALAAAATRLIEAPDLAARLAKAGQAWAQERFDVNDMVRRIDELYQQLWDKRTRRKNHRIA